MKSKLLKTNKLYLPVLRQAGGLTCLRATHRQAPEEIAIVYDSSSGGGKMNNGFNVGAQFIAPFFDNSNTTADTTKQGVMNHAPTNTTEKQRRGSRP